MSGVMGLMVSDRTFYIAHYEEIENDQGHTVIVTTEGNKHIEEANKSRTGKDVVGTVFVEYLKVTFDA